MFINLLRFVKQSLWNLMLEKKLTSVDLNIWQNIALLQPNVSPGHYNLNIQANEINFENCSA